MKAAAMTALMLLAVPAAAQDRPFASAAEMRAAVKAMEREMKPGQTFHLRTLVKDGDRTAALEYWKAAGRPAIHPAEAEYATVVEGGGTLIWGGRMTDPETTRPDLLQGGRIEGGQTRRLAPGDVILIPAGVPHAFTVDNGKLVLLGMKLPK